jgi:hypothetical protein
MTTINDIFDIPTQVHQGDFVLRLTEGGTRPADTLSTYVVTPQLEVCFDQTLGLIKSALESHTSKGAYLHGSFGSGKSHFMAVLTLLLQHNPDARSVPELAAVVAKHNAWTEGRRFLVVPYHMIGAVSLESAVLGHYAEYIRARHPEAPTPGFYRAEKLFDDARRLRAAMGDAAFFNKLGSEQGDDDGWGQLGGGWDAVSFEAAMAAPPMSEARVRLVGDLVDAYFESARSMASTDGEGFVSLDEGLSIMSKHAQALGYDAVVLFLDELILWLASHAADHAFLSREGQKVGKLVESMTAERPIPLVSFIARQRDLRELVGDYLPGAEQLGFADVLNWWEARFDEVTLEDRNLPAIVEKRLLRPKSPAAAQELQTAFERTARVREEVMSTLLTRAGDRDMFRQVYPFSPALVQTLVAISSLLQRERTALKLMLQLLVNQREVLQLGDIVPVGDLFDVIVEGDEPFTQAMRLNFDHAKKLYQQKLRPMLEQEHGVTVEDVEAGAVDAALAQRFRTDDRLLKTLILSALAPEVEALRALTPSRLAALNHGSIRSPIPGQESQIVLNKCRNWAAQVGEIKIAEEGANPAISLHIVGVDTEGILANAQGADNYGNRIQKARSLLCEQIGLEGEDSGLLPPRYEMLWRGTRRTCDILFRNVRELSLESFRAPEDMWRVVIDFPFDREGRTPADDRAKLQEFAATGESSNCLVWLPSFLTPRGMEDLGRLVLLDHVLSGNRLNEYGSYLSQIEREQARPLLQNQRDQMRQRLRNTLLAAYGISSMHTDAVDTSHDLDQHFVSLNPALTLQPPVGATFKDALDHLFAQALAHQFPAHPPFDVEVRRPGLRRVLEVVQQAAQARDGRVEVERSQRDEVRRLAVPLQLGDMGETHFVLRDAWKSHFLRKQAEEGMPGLTVRRLRAWMDQPEAMGLPRDIQNLVIMGFALQGDYAFSLHGGPVEPRLERLDDELELREQPLPDEALWQGATQRLAAILGVVAAPLLNATSLAAWVEETKRETVRLRPAMVQLCTALKTRLTRLGIDASDAPRMQTAQASLALLSDVAEADDAEVVNIVASAAVATSAAAMGHAIKQAAALVGTLDRAPWDLFDRMAHMTGEGAPQAEVILAQIRDALTRDEHVVHLADVLKDAQADAYELLTKMAQGSQTTTPPPPAPVPAPVAAPVLPRKPDPMTHARRGLKSEEALEVLASIEQALAANPDLALDIDWRLYPNDETSP